MPHSQLTQCPHCKASFKVSEEQLNAANGRVRCGACLNIFDAIAYQISTSPPTATTSPNKESEHSKSILEDEFDFALEDGLPNDTQVKSKPTDLMSDDGDVFADDPEEDKQEKGYSGSSFGDELSTSFLELEKSGKDHFKTQFLAADDELENENEESIDESWTESILDDLEEPTERKEPGFSLTNNLDEPKDIHNETQTNSKYDNDNDFPVLDQKELNSLKFQYDQDDAPKNRWVLGSLLFLVNFGLLLALLAQASWFHYEKLVKYPKVASFYALACEQLKCTLPELKDISKIENRNLVVRSHPTTFNALIIETIITNQASFEQTFPHISLSFSNINNQTVAQRLFKPSEYLSKDLLEWSGMPSKQPIQITLEIIDPGPEAVNYKINFHPAPTSSLDQEADQMSTNQSKI